MDKVLNQILAELKQLNNKVDNLDKNQELLAKKQEILAEKIDILAEKHDMLAEKQDILAEKQDILVKKHDILAKRQAEFAVYNQTADLTEFRTETRQSLYAISDNIRFLLHKEQETEKEIFLLKEKKAK